MKKPTCVTLTQPTKTDLLPIYLLAPLRRGCSRVREVRQPARGDERDAHQQQDGREGRRVEVARGEQHAEEAVREHAERGRERRRRAEKPEEAALAQLARREVERDERVACEVGGCFAKLELLVLSERESSSP